MQQIKLRSHVGNDGILHLDLPSEFKGIDVDVTLTVTMEKVKENNEDLEENLSQLEWHEFIEKTAGSINDESFFRHPQPQYDMRESIE